MNEKLLQKKGRIVSQIAAELLGKQIDDRFMPIMYYQKKFDASQGTVQNAINFLKEKHAIELRNRGYQGSFIEAINYDILREFCEKKSVSGCMPLPHTKQLELLAHYLHRELQDPLTQVCVKYMQDEDMKWQELLLGHCDFIVCTRSAAQHYLDDSIAAEIVLELEDYGLMEEPVFISCKDEPIKKIGVTADDMLLRNAGISYARKERLPFVQLPASKLSKAFESREIQGFVSAKEHVGYVQDAAITPLSLSQEDMATVIVCRTDREEVKAMLVERLQVRDVKIMLHAYEEGTLQLQY